MLIGDNDVINSENSLKNAEENLSNCKAEIVKNAGHFLSIDQAEKVNDAIVNFIE